MNVQHNCRMRCAYPARGSWLVGQIRCASIAFVSKRWMRQHRIRQEELDAADDL
ncbi:hypothetical protein [Escherichia albertii]|uniref:hypothetical protein n=1 Tax=Escherichia albertii TaxID=208962 RepID=UPI00235F19AA|nr:hypothetical protein [Escherichia albertii]WDC06116.1 hypothetical protein PS036_20615 [Escherichia albertii]